MKKSNLKSNAGFTLIEALVAVAILAIAVSGPLYAANRAIISVKIARDELIASGLAQEAVEYVRLMRDNAYLAEYRTGGGNVSTRAWTEFTSGVGESSIAKCAASACTLDPAEPMSTALRPCSGNTCTPLYLTTSDRGAIPRYTQQSNLSGSRQTAFTRTVQATTITANEAQVISTVSWNNHGVPYTITVRDHLTSWQ